MQKQYIYTIDGWDVAFLSETDCHRFIEEQNAVRPEYDKIYDDELNRFELVTYA